MQWVGFHKNMARLELPQLLMEAIADDPRRKARKWLNTVELSMLSYPLIEYSNYRFKNLKFQTSNEQNKPLVPLTI